MSTSDFRTLTSFPLEITWTVQNLGVTSAILEDKLLLFSFLQKNQKNLLKKTKRCIEKSLVKRVFWICYHEKMIEEEAPMTNSLIPWSWTALEIASATSSDSSTIISNWTFHISQDFRFMVTKTNMKQETISTVKKSMTPIHTSLWANMELLGWSISLVFLSTSFL